MAGSGASGVPPRATHRQRTAAKPFCPLAPHEATAHKTNTRGRHAHGKRHPPTWAVGRQSRRPYGARVGGKAPFPAALCPPIAHQSSRIPPFPTHLAASVASGLRSSSTQSRRPFGVKLRGKAPSPPLYGCCCHSVRSPTAAGKAVCRRHRRLHPRRRWRGRLLFAGLNAPAILTPSRILWLASHSAPALSLQTSLQPSQLVFSVQRQTTRAACPREVGSLSLSHNLYTAPRPKRGHLPSAAARLPSSRSVFVVAVRDFLRIGCVLAWSFRLLAVLLGAVFFCAFFFVFSCLVFSFFLSLSLVFSSFCGCFPFLFGFCRGGCLRLLVSPLLVRGFRGRHPRGAWLLSFVPGGGCVPCLRWCLGRSGLVRLVGGLVGGFLGRWVLGCVGVVWWCSRSWRSALSFFLIFFKVCGWLRLGCRWFFEF